ncbi:tetratricopeptide repeat protein [Marivita sp. GX14005]|uniref:tetratricopeptide repeat protein n=1 Tax=Marivita sp. GX14005 TaxID=2942276 RepID=UPI0020190B45|nr:tetratricopeptide repeat protein [Marivita sp. GX14005]MCL3883295.1 tetratricopeptide repeat protein [Marivita sp. GX14005]
MTLAAAEDQGALLRHCLAELVPDAGPLAPVLAGLAEGRDIADTLGLPPGVADLLYAQGYARLDAGQARRAAVLFQSCCVLDPGGAAVWLGLGVALIEAGAFDLAGAALDTAISLDPGSGAAQGHLARARLAMGDRDGAARAVRAFRATPRDAGHMALAPLVERIAGSLGMAELAG